MGSQNFEFQDYMGVIKLSSLEFLVVPIFRNIDQNCTPILFMIYIADLPKQNFQKPKIFSDQNRRPADNCISAQNVARRAIDTNKLCAFCIIQNIFLLSINRCRESMLLVVSIFKPHPSSHLGEDRVSNHRIQFWGDFYTQYLTPSQTYRYNFYHFEVLSNIFKSFHVTFGH